MIPSSLIIHLEIILFTVLTNGQNNPLFMCNRNHNHNETSSVETYDIVFNGSDDVVVVNCAEASTIAQILDRLMITTTLQGTTLNIDFDTSILQTVPILPNVTTDMDLSGNNMTEIDLQRYEHLKSLNLSSNRIRSLTSVKLGPNVTLVSLDMSRNKLLRFEYLSIPATRKLLLRSNNIFQLQPNITLPDTLEELDLTRNEIENITEVVFRSEHLKVLNLSINLINAFSRSVIQHLPQLRTLILECNKIFHLDSGTFSANVKLVELNLRDNNLSTLKKGVFQNLTNLQILDLSKNNLLQLTPETLQNLNNLMDFSVSENYKLCQYAACKRNLEFLLVLGGRLRSLTMDRLHLSKFPLTLTTSVRHLDLSKNKLNAVQLGNLENFPYLQTLTLTGNEIDSVESQVFSSMEFLMVLRLDHNRLTRVPPSLPSSLTELRLDHNRIKSIEKSTFDGLVKLVVLKLNSNAIQSIASGSMTMLRSLQTLDISNNPILKINTDSLEGLSSLRTLLATDLRRTNVNSTDLRFFPASEMRNLRSLNLTSSIGLARAFISDIPFLATIQQLETLDLSYTNLSTVPEHLQNYLPRLKLVRLRGNVINCSDNWFNSREFDYRELFASRTGQFGVKIRVTRDHTPLPSNQRDCVYTNYARFTVSSDKFWRNVNKTRIRLSYQTSTLPPVSTFGNVPFTGSTIRSPAKSSRKKVNTRSLHIAQFTNQSSNHTNTTSSSNSSTTSVTLPIPTTMPTTSQLTRLNVTIALENEKTLTTPSTSISTTTVATTFALLRNTLSTYNTTISLTTSPPLLASNDHLVGVENVTIIPLSIGLSSTNTSVRANESDFQASTVPQQHSKGHYEPLVWNQTDDYGSFFDWFPGRNESSVVDLAERSMKAQDTAIIRHTHPGLVVFSAISCFLLFVVFASLIAPPYVQKYKWRRQRYKMSQFDNECQRSIEISSISAFVETEIPLE